MTFEFEPKPEGLLLEILTLLQEEAAEVIQAVSKVKRFGVNANNIKQLQREMIEFQIIATLLLESTPLEVDLTGNQVTSHTDKKLNKLKVYTEHIKYLFEDSE